MNLFVNFFLLVVIVISPRLVWHEGPKLDALGGRTGTQCKDWYIWFPETTTRNGASPGLIVAGVSSLYQYFSELHTHKVPPRAIAQYKSASQDRCKKRGHSINTYIMIENT